ncbi:orotate phosphoribosyltransferase [Cellulomonas fulva]|uniref:orotate phosphoribosyltransferase n=1 Tax=Cellulomonas fulva TaxID=2835530 RepID=UPI0027DD156B|nr:orotate phosphoribosyltransferase [Cellulomonas fulva]
MRGPRRSLAQRIDSLCRLEGEFVLRSGTVASEYFDKYLFESDPHTLRAVAERMVPLLPPDTDVLGGLELGGVPIATILSSLTSLPVAFVRKEAKTYGTCRLAEGRDVTGARVTLVEDVITTGGAVRAAAVALRAQSAVVSTVLCAIDRSPAGHHPLADAGVEIRSVLVRADLDRARARA